MWILDSAIASHLGKDFHADSKCLGAQRNGLEIGKLSYSHHFAVSRLFVWLLDSSLTSLKFCFLIYGMTSSNLMIFKSVSSSTEVLYAKYSG